MWRPGVLGFCMVLAGCERLVVITAVDRPDPADADADAHEDSDAYDSDPDTAEGPTYPPEVKDAGSDSAPPQNTPLDASRGDAGPSDDAGDDGAIPAPDAGADASLPACAGKRVLNLCWYLGEPGASCDQTCRDRGGFDGRTLNRVGTSAQGGSLRNCTQVLGALGYSGSVIPGYREDDIGLGCHVWEQRDGWWLGTMPDFTSAARTGAATIACACLR